MPRLLDVMSPIEFEPTIELSEQDVPGLGDITEGQQTRMILNYKVIEKTKSFTILRITGTTLFPSARVI